MRKRLPVNYHPDESTLDEYLLERLSEPELSRIEEHLLICDTCRNRLDEFSALRIALLIAGLRPASQRLSFCHETEDGLIVSEVNDLGKGRLLARHVGSELDGATIAKTISEAIELLHCSFASMYPAHICTERCQVNPIKDE
jgi:hypothetical protein